MRRVAAAVPRRRRHQHAAIERVLHRLVHEERFLPVAPRQVQDAYAVVHRVDDGRRRVVGFEKASERGRVGSPQDHELHERCHALQRTICGQDAGDVRPVSLFVGRVGIAAGVVTDASLPWRVGEVVAMRVVHVAVVVVVVPLPVLHQAVAVLIAGVVGGTGVSGQVVVGPQAAHQIGVGEVAAGVHDPDHEAGVGADPRQRFRRAHLVDVDGDLAGAGGAQVQFAHGFGDRKARARGEVLQGGVALGGGSEAQLDPGTEFRQCGSCP